MMASGGHHAVMPLLVRTASSSLRPLSIHRPASFTTVVSPSAGFAAAGADLSANFIGILI